MKSLSNEQRELMALRELSARLGRNPLLVQASSGNVSLKTGDSLWIKASGKWLHHADTDDFLVEVGIARAKRCLRDDTAIPETEKRPSGCPRASIETAMHAVLPQRVVVHVHSVNTIAWAVRRDGPEQLRIRLAGFRWGWIPYRPSGSALANEIERVLSCFPQTDVLVLGNHGLVVCGDCCRSAEHLLAEVENRLAVKPRPAPECRLEQLERELPGSDWFVPRWAGVHALADHISQRILSGGVLYPCQAMFLPGTVPALCHDHTFHPSRNGQQMFRLLDNHGVLCSKRMTAAEQQMLMGLANVVRRVDASASVRYLTDSEVEDVLKGGAKSYLAVANMDYHPDATAR